MKPFAHLRAVTGMSDREAAAHLDASGAIWMARNRRTWSLDLRILTVAGIELAAPPTAARRADIAAIAANRPPP